MLIKIKNLILRLPLAIKVTVTVLLLSACLPLVADQNSSNIGNKNLNVNPNTNFFVVNQTGNKKGNNNEAILQKDITTSVELNARFAEAALENAESKKNLQWIFGKKTQTGWYLYEPLIVKEIGVSLDDEPVEFAEALSRWQKNKELKPTGVFDEQTMFAFISEWQKSRLFNREIPADQLLIVAPPEDFYDSSREMMLRQVERETYDAYKRMVKAAADSLKLKTNAGKLDESEKFLKIISSYRTKEYQQKLRTASPNSGSAGLAVNSPHFTGRALDIYVGGDPVSTADANRAIQIKTPAYLWMVENAEKFGFRPYFYEPWHWEFVP